MERNVQDNKRLAQAYLEAVQSGDVDAIAGFYAPDGVMCTTGNTLGSGVFDVAQIRQAAAGAFAVFPSGMRFTVLGMTGEGSASRSRRNRRPPTSPGRRTAISTTSCSASATGRSSSSRNIRIPSSSPASCSGANRG